MSDATNEPTTNLKAEQREERRQRFLAVARTVFGERGYDGVSIEQIARETGASVGALYLYFKNKEQLYLQCYNLPYTSIHEAVLAVIDGTANNEERGAIRSMVARQKELSDIASARGKVPRKRKAAPAVEEQAAPDLAGEVADGEA